MADKMTVSKAMKRNESRGDKMAFEYEAVKSTDKRKPVKRGQRPHRDLVLNPYDRKKAENSTSDIIENMPLAGWMVRRHLDAVSKFYVDVDSSAPFGKDTRDRIESLFKWAGLARNFDAARRHSISEAFRLYELNKVLDGDSMMVKINRRNSPRYGSIQLVEGTRIARPNDLPPFLNGYNADKSKKISDHGLELDNFGGVKSYIVCKYNQFNRQLMFDKRVMARDAIYSGYFDMYSQTRGISPLLCAINQFLDIKQSQESILLKINLHALFGIAITKEAIDGVGDGLPSYAEDVTDQDADDGEDLTEVSREVDLSGGPFTLNLLDGEKAVPLESNTPPESVKAYTELAIRSALLAMDIPYSFFDGEGTNFAKVIADRKMYEIAAESKRDKNQEAYEQYVDWKLGMWTADDTLPMEYSDIRQYVHVRPYPSPWLDKASEIDAEERAISLGIKSIPQLARERGVDPFEILEQQSEFLKRAQELDVPVFIGNPGARSERDNRIDNDIREEETNEETD